MKLCIIALLIGLFQPSWSCPEECTCRPGLVRCVGKSLTKIPIEDIPFDTVQLSLDDNFLTSLGPSDFRNLSNLEILSLSDNDISVIDENTFTDLTKLIELRLNENKLTSLPQNIFASTPLETLSLRQNSFVGLPNGIFSSLGKLQNVDLRENPFSCDCVTEWLREWIANNSAIVTRPDLIVCDHPPSLNGKQISLLSKDQFICAAPNFTASPAQTTVRTTLSLTLPCSATGRPPPSFTWRRNNQTLTSDDRITIQDTGSLVISSVLHEDDGLYQCTASNIEDTVTTPTVKITVEELTCFDGLLTSAHETDVDCGGPYCKPCNQSQACKADRDCRDTLLCLGPHQLKSKLLYISKANALYETCANETKAPELIETRLRNAWIAREEPFPNLDASANMETIVTELKDELAAQFKAPLRIFKNVKISSFERQIKAPLLQIEFELDHDSDTDTADDIRANLETIVHEGNLLGTLSLKDGSYKFLVTL